MRVILFAQINIINYILLHNLHFFSVLLELSNHPNDAGHVAKCRRVKQFLNKYKYLENLKQYQIFHDNASESVRWQYNPLPLSFSSSRNNFRKHILAKLIK